MIRLPSGDYVNPVHVVRLTSHGRTTTLHYLDGSTSSEEAGIEQVAALLMREVRLTAEEQEARRRAQVTQ